MTAISDTVKLCNMQQQDDEQIHWSPSALAFFPCSLLKFHLGLGTNDLGAMACGTVDKVCLYTTQKYQKLLATTAPVCPFYLQCLTYTIVRPILTWILSLTWQIHDLSNSYLHFIQPAQDSSALVTLCKTIWLWEAPIDFTPRFYWKLTSSSR